MTQSACISLYQPLLHSIALKLVGSVQDAEDIVQDTFLKWLSIDNQQVNNTKAYLIKSVTNNCINHLNSFSLKNKLSIDSVNIKEFIDRMDISHLDIKQEISDALHLIHKKLGPLERAVFLLREVFEFDYEDIQKTLDTTKDNCRQLLSRAKKKLIEETPKFHFSFENHASFVQTFREACTKGNMNDLIDYLKK